jgi:Spy/CpxP family protein refolding chaperone
MKRTLVAMGTMLVLLPQLAWAQPVAQKRAQVRQHISDYVVQQSTQQLGLDATQAGRFREIWSRYDQQLWGVHKEQGMAMKELKEQLATPTPNEALLTQLADTIVRNKAKVQQLEAQRTEELRHVLTAVQFGKGLVIAPKLQHDVKEQTWKAMHPNAALPPEEAE